ncbi:MAG: TIGR00297 family protein [Candidatus Methanofastidiosia archaeon]
MISSPHELLKAFLFCLFIGILALKAKVIRGSGFLSGGIVGMSILIFGGWNYFALILAFFVIGGATTKYKYEQKRRRGVAQEKKGARGFGNVFGNGLCAMFFALAEGLHPSSFFFAGYLGAVSTAMADTVGGEIGRLSKKDPYLITNLKKVPTGTEGAISLLGLLAELAISAFVGVLAVVLKMESLEFSGLEVVLSATTAGFLGAKMDSILGATLETKLSWWENNQTNFWATAFGALFGIFFYLSVR